MIWWLERRTEPPCILRSDYSRVSHSPSFPPKSTREHPHPMPDSSNFPLPSSIFYILDQRYFLKKTWLIKPTVSALALLRYGLILKSTRREASMLLNHIKFYDRLLQSPDILCLTIFRLLIRTAANISCFSTSLKRHYSSSANGCWLSISGKIFT